MAARNSRRYNTIYIRTLSKNQFIIDKTKWTGLLANNHSFFLQYRIWSEYLDPVVSMLDNAIQRTSTREINRVIHWIDFYPVYSAMVQRLNNRDLIRARETIGILEKRACLVPRRVIRMSRRGLETNVMNFPRQVWQVISRGRPGTRLTENNVVKK